MDRKSFEYLPGDENPHFIEEGIRIYKELRNKYPGNNEIDLDNVLNGLCAALIVLMRENMPKSDHKYFLQLLYKIISQNIE